jgi:NAD/NADP transhydrogenase beta subunit
MLSFLAAGSAEGGVNPWAALAYLVAGVLFILALRGLSHPTTSRAGNRYGMVGMLIAVVTTGQGRTNLENLGWEIDGTNGATFRDKLAREIKLWREVVTTANIKIN